MSNRDGGREAFTGFGLIRRLFRLVLAVFYRRIEGFGLDRVPGEGPLIVTANHWNALVDPMLVVATLERRLVPVAKAPLFRHPLIAPFLWLIGAIPVHRRQEGGGDPARNEAMFAAATRTLRGGGAILIFPEGLSQPEPTLMPLRTGVARMLLAAEAAAGGTLGVRLLPVGLVFHEPGTFRTGRAAVLVGEPVPTADCVALYRTAPEAAVRTLTERLAVSLRGMIVDADDRQTLALLELLESAARPEGSFDDARRADPAARAAWMRDVMRGYRALRTLEPERVARFRADVERYAKDLELAGLAARELSRRYTKHAVLRYALREGLSLVVGLPLALWGIVSHALPYQLTRIAVRMAGPDPAGEATYKILTGAVLYPLCWIAEGWLAWGIGGRALLALFLVSLLPTGFFALTWRERLDRFRREARAFLRFILHRDLSRHLDARRHAIVDEFGRLARLVSGDP